MKTILSSQNYIQKLNSLTNELSYAYGRWDKDEMESLFKKAVFENLLADYHSYKILSNAFKSFLPDLNYDFQGTDLFLHLKIDSYVDASLPLTLWKNQKDIKASLEKLSKYRSNILTVIENYLSREELENKILITRTLVTWYNTIRRLNLKFFIGRIKNISSDFNSVKDMETNYYYSNDIFLTFQNFNDKLSDKRILIVSPFINNLSMAFWFDGFEISILSNHYSQLFSISFSSSQFLDMVNQNIYNPSPNFKYSRFNVLYDEDFTLKRFNTLEDKSYSACMINYVFSSSSKIDPEKITFQLNRIKSLMKTNSMILIQEASIIENLLDEILSNLDIRVILKVRFIENQEITNWLVIANKI